MGRKLHRKRTIQREMTKSEEIRKKIKNRRHIYMEGKETYIKKKRLNILKKNHINKRAM